MTSSLDTEWDYSGRKGRDGKKKKIGKANERKRKVKRAKDEEVNGEGEKGHTPDTAPTLCLHISCSALKYQLNVRYKQENIIIMNSYKGRDILIG